MGRRGRLIGIWMLSLPMRGFKFDVCVRRGGWRVRWWSCLGRRGVGAIGLQSHEIVTENWCWCWCWYSLSKFFCHFVRRLRRALILSPFV
jgi:hypothetical protein